MASDQNSPDVTSELTSELTSEPRGDRHATEGTARPGVECAGTRIGPYKLVKPIGEGGMGSVWMAEQQEPVRRVIALKIIKAGMDSVQVVARFEAERQALALMDHPNIARVFDAGTTDSGRPYFVMELVKGIPITHFCDEQRFSPRQRLDLFVQVCQALQHAHQKGIIHRDIKPSNVLVALYDDRPVVKVIDFGIAKASGQRLTEQTVFTQLGGIVGTLEYMSPEQAEPSNQDIDTRSDIYSLGVLLYELLTGTTPLDRARLQKAAYGEVLRIIREEEPLKPSTRLSLSKESLASVSALRHTEPAQLTRIVRGELDWIVMKALDKDRARRYETANSFARDVERYLHDDPVEACAPSAAYTLRKFARRNRRMLATAIAFVALLVAGTVVSMWQAIEAKQGREQAQRSDAESKSVLKFFEDNVLAAPRLAGPYKGLGKDVSLLKAVDAAEPSITPSFKGQPLAEASVRAALAGTYFGLGEYDKAAAQGEQALRLRLAELGPNHPDTLRSSASLGIACLMLDQVDRGTTLLEEALKGQTAQLGTDNADTISTKRLLYIASKNAGKWDRAIQLSEEILAKQRANPNAEPVNVLLAQSDVGDAYLGAGQLARATALLDEVVAGLEARLGPNDSRTIDVKARLGVAYQKAHDFERAIPLLERGVAEVARWTGADHPALLRAQTNLAQAYRDVGQGDRAIELLQRILAAQRVQLRPDDSDTLSTEYSLFNLHQGRGEFAEAEPLLREFVAAQKRLKGSDHKDVAAWLALLGSNCMKQQKWPEAEAAFRECLAIREARTPDDWIRFSAKSLLGESLLEQRKYDEAAPLLLVAFEGLKQREAAIPENANATLPKAVERLVRLYEAWGKESDAARWRAELDLIKQP